MFSSRPFIIDFLDSFQKLLKAFSICGDRFHEIAMAENGRGKEGKKNG
jgi:hypothetical protein